MDISTVNVIITGAFSVAASFAATFVGILVTSKLTAYRLEQLEKKVDKHNSVMERTFALERDVSDIKEYIKDEIYTMQKEVTHVDV